MVRLVLGILHNMLLLNKGKRQEMWWRKEKKTSTKGTTKGKIITIGKKNKSCQMQLVKEKERIN